MKITMSIAGTGIERLKIPLVISFLMNSFFIGFLISVKYTVIILKFRRKQDEYFENKY